MKCASCDAPGMRTIATFDIDYGTVRIKQCRVCLKKAQTQEQYLTEAVQIPETIRRPKGRTTST